MLLGFKRRFAPYVADGSKTHTIRATRKNPPRVGDTCHCYVDPRQKSMALIGRYPCVKVEAIQFYECGDGRFSVWIGDNELTPDEKAALAWRDGFRNYEPHRAFTEMVRFWMREHGDGRQIVETFINFQNGEPIIATPRYGTQGLSFKGHIIHWQWSVNETHFPIPHPAFLHKALGASNAAELGSMERPSPHPFVLRPKEMAR